MAMAISNPKPPVTNTATDSPFRSPNSYLTNPSPSPPRTIAFPALADPPPPETERAPQEMRSVGAILRNDSALNAAIKNTAVAVRVLAAVLCMVSFSVMAADKNKGWTLDSFDRYTEYKYCLAVNVIGFVYAGYQVVADVYHKVHKKHVVSRAYVFYLDFAMDQILSYLLISASSSASSRTDYWVTNYGNDPFPKMISGSVAMSFLAFMSFAVSSLISAYNLFSSRTL